ncbi:phage tail tape measure protein [Pseudomonas juntendi]|uniref:phage tail tape measure protein n=1 Tax=Pseudomonas juntendi TaxID=2666183 RepID=UPI001FFDD796|nr:phage tail tape measure protein [Pseudomonas juntendi]MCK2116533.1 phage tail tape measure protein [Pseudomonas juntendi]
MAGSTIIQLVLRARDDMSKGLGSATAKITALIAAFAGASAIKETVGQLTELEVAAKRLQVSVEDLTAAQYAAFKTSGVGAEQFVEALEEVRIKIEEMNSIQSGGAIDFFQIMKTSSAEFMKLNPLEQLQKISDVMKDMSSSAQFTFLDQIGSDNLRNLLPLLEDGSGKFKDLMTEAKAAGYTLNSLDTKNVEQLSRTFSELSTSITTSFKKAVADAAPEFTALIQMMLQGTTDVKTGVDELGNSGREQFRSIVSAAGQAFAAFGRVGDALFSIFFAIAKGATDTAGVFALGFDQILTYLSKFVNSFVTFYRRAFADVLALVGTSFVPSIQALLNKIPGSMASSMSAGLDNVKSYIAKSVVDLNKPINIQMGGGIFKDFAAQAEGVSKTLDKLGQEAVKATLTGVGGISGAISTATDKLLDAGAAIEAQNKALVDQDAARAKLGIDKGGDAKNALTNTQTAATLAATQAKLQGDLAKMAIDKNIERIQTQQQLDQKALDDRVTREKLTAGEVADARLDIDLKANREISDQRKASIGEDLKVLQTQLAAQRKVLGQSTIDSERGTALGAIADLEAQIVLKRQDQVNLTSQLANQEALLRADRASALADSKAQVEAIKEQLQVDLLRIRGSEYKADLLEIERDFADTKRVLEALGEDSTAASDLVSAKKAKAELDEIDRQYAALKRKLENNQISSKDYLSQVNALGERGQKAAEVTGNQDEVDRTKDSLESARSEVFSFGKTWKDLQSSMSNGLGDAFTSIISGSKNAREAFAEMGAAMIATIMQVVAQLLVQYAIQSMLGMVSGGASTAAGAVMGGVKHDGGLIGSGGGRRRSVPEWMFGGAMKYHTGGVIGLKPNEVPIIAEKGEEMLTANDPRHRNNIIKGSGVSATGSQPRVTINNVIDAPSIASALEGADGERVIMNHIRANRAEIKSM